MLYEICAVAAAGALVVIVFQLKYVNDNLREIIRQGLERK